MCRTISFKVSSGMDSAVRVLTTLRRKQFDVKGFSMESIDANNSEFRIMLEDEKKQGFDRAMLHMKKFVDVYDVCEYMNN
nr:ACT domain-containing protein [Sedimentibacter sp.]